MPKVLVLFDSGDQRADRLAELAADGAKKVRFTEVDIRVVGNESASNSARRKRLESGDTVDQYDGVVVVGSDQEPAAAIDALLATHDQNARSGFIDRVFAAVSDAGSSHRLTELRGIVVGPLSGSTNAESTAGNIGERVAKVAEWVRHALSHEHGHGHSHHDHAEHHHSR